VAKKRTRNEQKLLRENQTQKKKKKTSSAHWKRGRKSGGCAETFINNFQKSEATRGSTREARDNRGSETKTLKRKTERSKGQLIQKRVRIQESSAGEISRHHDQSPIGGGGGGTDEGKKSTSRSSEGSRFEQKVFKVPKRNRQEKREKEARTGALRTV